ncbi:MAG: MiaB/RimO family radical SAM methylthiotransferase [Elusimicrobiaceae bacterium]|jgi:tRNA-2-methylthio-N6-dimethylallyladenosine synthase|nr:MiaB/RimO family radical SAM methylthiotransferase [Elusimicrobiaceae bacterium]MBT3954730.1 MiaB/RimO family radical SAM methylthiotransferase [Elusimicrobiaceae bacterium]MBT4008322.1 MiaB/RimO family radical SAM methylthiotransferase [Elusimicrobiaceae bacterium]MBT4402452.1 MiaB/RimO family radical SAM methylthiotransferase [Elusimicrobiaceae bacterium]MBT4439384.1 MiaB/RimO family radical SAM methylthiotransferase [Elusimicrobiaceae bacterium]
MKPKKVFIKTYGCQMNEADSDEMSSIFSLYGTQETKNIKKADVVLVNSCTVRANAENKALSFLGRLKKWKGVTIEDVRGSKKQLIIFAGCAAQRLGAEVRKKHPHLDITTGAKSIEKFAEVLDNSGFFDGQSKKPHHAKSPANPLGVQTIMRGCDFACTYCIVPSVRGGVKCLSKKEIISSIEQKIKNGAKEIVLLGQTVNAWRYGKTDFADLLKEVSKLSNLKRVSFMSPHPIHITDKLIDTIKNNPKIARNIHLPIQSGSTKILKDMKRGYSRRDILIICKKLKDIGIKISTDFIVGYPTETEKDFKDTISIVEKIGFSHAYCFIFSPRQGTKAEHLKPLDKKVLEKRVNILLNKVKQKASKLK